MTCCAPTQRKSLQRPVSAAVFEIACPKLFVPPLRDREVYQLETRLALQDSSLFTFVLDRGQEQPKILSRLLMGFRGGASRSHAAGLHLCDSPETLSARERDLGTASSNDTANNK